MSFESTGICRQELCTFAKDGKCLEGISNIQECPHFSAASSEEDKEDQAQKTEFQGMIDLHDGKALSLEDSSIITKASPTRVILFAGAPDSGKTTLITSIYQLFEKGPFAGYIFAGSRTLPGFERRCHLSRTDSGRTKPNTERTKHSEGQNFLHLRVREINLVEPSRDLLLSDLSGEYFDSAMNSNEECRRLSIIQRADHFVLFLDGEKLSQAELRHKAMTDGISFLRSCLDSGMLGTDSHVDILFAKWDLALVSPRKQEVIEFTSHIEETIKARFESRIGFLRFFRISARPVMKSKLPLAYKLDQAFPEWVRIFRFPTVKITGKLAQGITPYCEFDRYFFIPQQRI